MLVHKAKLKVRYYETDQMGIVHHSNYYRWFEVARTELLDAIGFNYAKVEKEGILLPIVETNCHYKRGAKYGDTVIVEAFIERLTYAKIIMNYKVLRENDGCMLAKGYTVQAFVDQDFKVINFKKQYPKTYQQIVEHAKEQ